MDVVKQLRALCPHDNSGYCGCTAIEAADTIERLQAQLAASQAYAQQLRDIIDHAFDNFETKEFDYPLIVQQALALPQDDTALRQWGAKMIRNWLEDYDVYSNDDESVVDYLLRKAEELREGKS